MLNISATPQINSPTENNIAATVNSSSSGTSKSDGKKFEKVLQHEVSEAANKHEKNNKPVVNEHSGNPTSSKETENESDANANANATSTESETVVADGTANFIQTLLNNSTNQININHSQPSMESILDPDAKTALPNMPQVSATVLPNSLTPQDSKPAQGLMAPTANPMLQQKLAQPNLITNDYFSLPNNIWQSFNSADSAVDGNLLPFLSEMNSVTQSTAGESIFFEHNESITPQTHASQPLSLSNTGTLNAVPQDIHVDLPINQPKWGGEFAQKVVWLTSQQNQVAEIHLNPAHLGPVEVMLTITQDQATAQFVSPHLAVREAIQEALPRLREMMAESGIQLGNVMVGADSFQQENKQQQNYQSTKNATHMLGAEVEAGNQIETVTTLSRHLGMVNTYA